MDGQAELLARLSAMAGDAPDDESEGEEAEALPKAGSFLSNIIVNPENATAAALCAIHAEQLSADPDTGQRCRGIRSGAMARTLRELTDAAVKPGAGTQEIERALICGAVLLGNLVAAWTARAMDADTMDKMEVFARLLLQAQKQQKQTLGVLAEIRNPRRAMFIKQLNAARNQQINHVGNSPSASRSENFAEPTARELLEVIPGERLDTRTQGQASGLDSHLEAVGAVHRAEDGRG
ncbi:MAG TPA: hypothetical protein PLU26_15975 [Candidatus Competibacter sp.]|nr:hypothetical protein [Candidatus Competibacteraceae bacterium]HUM95945.1 hypothetical protein [Candidatus Competibacter sp.]